MRRYKRLSIEGRVDVLRITRREAMIARFRRRTLNGRDVIVDMERGVTLHHGDVLSLEASSAEEEILIVEIIPEEAVKINVKADLPLEEQVEAALRLGYALGNMHLPVSIQGRTLWTPAEERKELIMNVASEIGGLNVEVERMRIEPYMIQHDHEGDHQH